MSSPGGREIRLDFLFGYWFGGHIFMEIMEELADAELLRRYANERSEVAFREFVNRHVNLVYRSALRQADGDRHRAEDVVQLVFLEVARRSAALAEHPRLIGWLHTTTHFITLSILRSERRRRLREHAALATEEQIGDVRLETAWNQVAPLLDDVLRELNSGDREAVLLHCLEGRTFAEVGARLSLKEDAVRMRVSRALEKLRTALVRRGVTCTAAGLSGMLATESAVAAPANMVASASALAAAPFGPSSAALSLFHIMNTSKLLISLTLGLGILGIGVGVFRSASDRNELVRLRAATAAANIKWQQVQGLTAEAASQAAEAGASRSRRNGVQSVRRPNPKASSGATPTTRPLPDLGEEMKSLVKSPTFEAAYLANNRSRLETAYQGLFQQLGLNADEVQRFKDAYMKNVQSNFDIGASASDQNIPITDPAILAMFEKARNEMIGDMRGIITPQQLAEYDQLHGRGAEVVRKLGDALSFTDAPLTAPQRDSLAEAVARSIKGSRGQVDWDSVTVQASTLLSPSQRTLLDSVQAADYYNREYAAITGGAP